MPGRARVDEGTELIAADRLAAVLGGPRRQRTLPGVENGDRADPSDDQVADGPAAEPGRETAVGGGGVDRAVLGGVRLVGFGRAFGRRHLGVIALLLVLGTVAAGWTFLRARPVADATPLVVTTTTLASPSARPTTPAVPTPTQAPILVHVLGAVRRPGVVSLPPRSRVQDALRAAGGLRADARPGQLNLASLLEDGEQIVIGTGSAPGGQVRTGAGPAPASSPDSGAGAGVAEVDLNTATGAQLDQLPAVGPVTAQRILAWRAQHGRFSRVEELQEVDGIGPKTYARIAPHVRV
jgi:competence protein ComEA